MRDQSGMVREFTKWDYELRYPEQVTTLVDRGLAIAMTEPRGPVFLSLPREPLAESWPDKFAEDIPLQAVPTRTQPDPDAVSRAAAMIAAAQDPLIIVQRGDPEGRVADALVALAETAAIPVIENHVLHNNMPSAHPMLAGHDVGPWIGDVDVILVVQSQVPWLQRNQKLADNTKVIHIGPDPLFEALPVRSFRNDLAITGDTASTLTAITAALPDEIPGRDARVETISAGSVTRRAETEARALEGDGSPMTPGFVSKCVSDVLGDDGIVFSELGVNPAPMDLKGPNRFFGTPFSGGLGWGMPAALGAALADPDRLSVACIGDGSYMFANPVACHQVAEAQGLPILTVIMNNGIWNAVRRAARNVYPDGQAVRMNTLPITSLEPLPDFCKIAEASRAYTERVEKGADLPAALARAIEVIRTEKRQALVEVRVAVPN
jgi:acetolactate synthase-1/2/3 large subunit